MNDIKCPYDLNQFLLGEPIFENTFPEEECEQRRFYGDCYHCFSTAIARRDHQLKYEMINKLRTEIELRPYEIANDSVIQGMKYERSDILKILDKYKAKSEGKEWK